MTNAKAAALAMIGKMPDDATWEDIVERVVLRMKIEAGLADCEAGRVTPHDQARREFEEWRASRGQTKPCETCVTSTTGSLVTH